MRKCKCGSYAVNEDPEEKECDVCLWKNKYIKLLEKVSEFKKEREKQ